jgi:hypothetical protein
MTTPIRRPAWWSSEEELHELELRASDDELRELHTVLDQRDLAPNLRRDGGRLVATSIEDEPGDTYGMTWNRNSPNGGLGPDEDYAVDPDELRSSKRRIPAPRRKPLTWHQRQDALDARYVQLRDAAAQTYRHVTGRWPTLQPIAEQLDAPGYVDETPLDLGELPDTHIEEPEPSRYEKDYAADLLLDYQLGQATEEEAEPRPEADEPEGPPSLYQRKEDALLHVRATTWIDPDDAGWPMPDLDPDDVAFPDDWPGATFAGSGPVWWFGPLGWLGPQDINLPTFRAPRKLRVKPRTSYDAVRAARARLYGTAAELAYLKLSNAAWPLDRVEVSLNPPQPAPGEQVYGRLDARELSTVPGLEIKSKPRHVTYRPVWLEQIHRDDAGDLVSLGGLTGTTHPQTWRLRSASRVMWPPTGSELLVARADILGRRFPRGPVTQLDWIAAPPVFTPELTFRHKPMQVFQLRRGVDVTKLGKNEDTTAWLLAHGKLIVRDDVSEWSTGGDYNQPAPRHVPALVAGTRAKAIKLKSAEIQVRRRAERQGLTFSKSGRRDRHALDFNQITLTDRAGHVVYIGPECEPDYIAQLVAADRWLDLPREQRRPAMVT